MTIRMSSIAENLKAVKSTLPAGVELVAVSKFHPADTVMEAYQAGQRIFGESRVQELIPKAAALPGDIRWHFIGHLQTNKVSQLIGHVAMIESVDSLRLLTYIDRESERRGVVTRVLMEVHVAQEDTKSGFTPDELVSYFAQGGFNNLKATHICGIMGMASNTDNIDRINADFAEIAHTFQRIRDAVPEGTLRGFDTLSMGMSTDYPLAIGHGANLVRIGTAIFGERQY